MWIKTILLSLISVLLFYCLIFIFGWLDIGEQTNYEILRNIFIGQYLFFTVPVFIISLFALTGVGGFRSALVRMLIAVTISIAVYTLVVRYLVEKLNG